MGNINAEPIDASVEPKSKNLAKELPDLLVFPVEIRLALIEKMQIPLSLGAIWFDHPGPSWSSKYRLPVVGGKLARVPAAFAKHITVTLDGAGLCFESLLEPGVLAGRVVRYEVDNDPEP